MNIERILKDLSFLGDKEKLSGSKEAKETALYIKEAMEKHNINCKMYSFDAWLSNPLEGKLKVGEKYIKCRPRSFSEDCCYENVELFYDHTSTLKNVSSIKKAELKNKIKGKIVVAYGYDEGYAKEVELGGAIGLIQIWESNDPLIHEDTVTPVWGTPDLQTSLLQPTIPVVGVTKEDGEWLINYIINKEENGEIPLGMLRAKTERLVTQVHLPVVEIEGKTKDFLLISSHYDTWYKGAMDNGCANAVTMELARTLIDNREKLYYSIKIAWWPGHSNGRYMGSTWYCDNFYKELKNHCYGHINSDLIGTMGMDTITVRTSGLEGKDYIKSLLKEVAPNDNIIFGNIGRGADQSFWGADIPYNFMFRYEQSPNKKTSVSPGPGVWWWHTSEDTLEKVDKNILEKEANILKKVVFTLSMSSVLPLNIEEYMNKYIDILENINNKCDEVFELEPIIYYMKNIKDIWKKKLKDIENMPNGLEDNKYRVILKKVGGAINRLIHTSNSPYNHDLALNYGPFSLLTFSTLEKECDCTPQDYLYRKTTFIRQKNRIMDELENIRHLLMEGGILND